MDDQTTPKVARKRGRPATGRDPVLAVRAPADMIARIESWRGEYEGMPLPVALRILLNLGLKTPPSALRQKDLIDPKDPDGTYVAPRSYKPKVEGGTPHPLASGFSEV